METSIPQCLFQKKLSQIINEAKKKLADVATVVSSLAKQMINNADVILRTEKLIAEGKLNESNIEKMI